MSREKNRKRKKPYFVEDSSTDTDNSMDSPGYDPDKLDALPTVSTVMYQPQDPSELFKKEEVHAGKLSLKGKAKGFKYHPSSLSINQKMRGRSERDGAVEQQVFKEGVLVGHNLFRIQGAQVIKKYRSLNDDDTNSSWKKLALDTPIIAQESCSLPVTSTPLAKKRAVSSTLSRPNFDEVLSDDTVSLNLNLEESVDFDEGKAADQTLLYVDATVNVTSSSSDCIIIPDGNILLSPKQSLNKVSFTVKDSDGQGHNTMKFHSPGVHLKNIATCNDMNDNASMKDLKKHIVQDKDLRKIEEALADNNFFNPRIIMKKLTDLGRTFKAMHQHKDTFFECVLNQLHDQGLSQELNDVTEFKQLLGSTILIDEDFYKEIGKVELQRKNITIQQFVDSLDSDKFKVGPLCIYAVARMCDIPFHLITPFKEWRYSCSSTYAGELVVLKCVTNTFQSTGFLSAMRPKSQDSASTLEYAVASRSSASVSIMQDDISDQGHTEQSTRKQLSSADNTHTSLTAIQKKKMTFPIPKVALKRSKTSREIKSKFLLLRSRNILFNKKKGSRRQLKKYKYVKVDKEVSVRKKEIVQDIGPIIGTVSFETQTKKKNKISKSRKLYRNTNYVKKLRRSKLVGESLSSRLRSKMMPSTGGKDLSVVKKKSVVKSSSRSKAKVICDAKKIACRQPGLSRTKPLFPSSYKSNTNGSDISLSDDEDMATVGKKTNYSKLNFKDYSEAAKDFLLKSAASDILELQEEVSKLKAQKQKLKDFIRKKKWVKATTKPKATTAKTTVDNSKPKQRYGCNYCTQIFSSKAEFADHLKWHSRRKYKCDKCPLSYSHKTSLNAHAKTHTGSKYQCAQCGKVFPRKDRLQQHIEEHRQTSKFICDQCGKCYKKKSLLQDHINTHSNSRPHQCSKCSKGYNRRSDLNLHLQTCGKKSTLPCFGCNKKFKIAKYLKIHIRTHMKDNEFVCHICGKILKSQNGLKGHLDQH